MVSRIGDWWGLNVRFDFELADMRSTRHRRSSPMPLIMVCPLSRSVTRNWKVGSSSVSLSSASAIYLVGTVLWLDSDINDGLWDDVLQHNWIVRMAQKRLLVKGYANHVQFPSISSITSGDDWHAYAEGGERVGPSVLSQQPTLWSACQVDPQRYEG